MINTIVMNAMNETNETTIYKLCIFTHEKCNKHISNKYTKLLWKKYILNFWFSLSNSI